MSNEANRLISMFFGFGVLGFLIFNYKNTVAFADGLVKTGVSLSGGLATIGQGPIAPQGTTANAQ
jgi:hypothetical protein